MSHITPNQHYTEPFWETWCFKHESVRSPSRTSGLALHAFGEVSIWLVSASHLRAICNVLALLSQPLQSVLCYDPPECRQLTVGGHCLQVEDLRAAVEWLKHQGLTATGIAGEFFLHTFQSRHSELHRPTLWHLRPLALAWPHDALWCVHALFACI